LIHDLKHIFVDLCGKADPGADANILWREIEDHYADPKRHYHDRRHVLNMLTQLERCREFIHDWDCVLFALFYHDFVYQATAKDNEEQSAVEAGRALTSLKLSPAKIDIVTKMILATKGHEVNQNTDINYFTDADLSILGASPGDYEQYTKDVRKEYSIYPDILYKPGRKKVLKHFMEMPALFKTEFFRKRLESQARENITRELESLS
jgi:predicted metal-dependent HD superfamily phosphohydrolase